MERIVFLLALWLLLAAYHGGDKHIEWSGETQRKEEEEFITKMEAEVEDKFTSIHEEIPEDFTSKISFLQMYYKDMADLMDIIQNVHDQIYPARIRGGVASERRPNSEESDIQKKKELMRNMKAEIQEKFANLDEGTPKDLISKINLIQQYSMDMMDLLVKTNNGQDITETTQRLSTTEEVTPGPTLEKRGPPMLIKDTGLNPEMDTGLCSDSLWYIGIVLVPIMVLLVTTACFTIVHLWRSLYRANSLPSPSREMRGKEKRKAKKERRVHFEEKSEAKVEERQPWAEEERREEEKEREEERREGKEEESEAQREERQGETDESREEERREGKEEESEAQREERQAETDKSRAEEEATGHKTHEEAADNIPKEEDNKAQPMASQERPLVALMLEVFRFHCVIGEGKFGKVLLATDSVRGEHVAIRIAERNTLQTLQIAKTTKRIHQMSYDCPFLIKCYAAIHRKDHIYHVLELARGGSLKDLLLQKGCLETKEVRHIAAELVCGLQFLHKRGFVHRTINLQNVLLTTDGHVKIVDFACAVEKGYGRAERCERPEEQRFSIPFLTLGILYDEDEDWFSLGTVLYELFTNRAPFIIKGDRFQTLFGTTEPSYEGLGHVEADFVRSLLCRDPSKQLGVNGDIRGHPFFKTIQWSELEAGLVPSPLGLLQDNIEVLLQQTHIFSTKPLRGHQKPCRIIKELMLGEPGFVCPEWATDYYIPPPRTRRWWWCM